MEFMVESEPTHHHTHHLLPFYQGVTFFLSDILRIGILQLHSEPLILENTVSFLTWRFLIRDDLGYPFSLEITFSLDNYEMSQVYQPRTPS